MFSKKTLKSFEAKYDINPATECWEWTASFARGGYGQFHSSVEDGRVWYRAHRFSYTAYKGAIPEGAVVMHLCDNPRCVNPDHLEVGSQADNIRDRDSKGRGPQTKVARDPATIAAIKSSPKSDRELAKELGCSSVHIWKIRSDRYVWARAEDTNG